MTVETTGTYSYDPAISELIIEAFGRIQVKPASFTAEHMMHARQSSQLALVSWSNRDVNLWAVDLQSIQLIQGVANYPILDNTITILDAYIETITTSNGTDTPNDRVVYPISRTEYSSLPNKTDQGEPTSFWFDRTTNPTVYVWPAPDQNGPYSFFYYRMRQLQDISLPNGTGLDLPFRFMDAFAAELAARLARKYAPALAMALQLEAKRAWDEAAQQDVEDVPLYLSPGLGGYYR